MWRVLVPDGAAVLGEHIRRHDHAGVQPFTRTQAGVAIPEDIERVVVQGRDERYGYNGGTATSPCLPRSPRKRGLPNGNTGAAVACSPSVEGRADSSGERTARFAELIEPEIEVMLRVASALTGGRADAEDVVQESLIRAYRGLDGFDGRHPRAWLLTILRRTHLNMNRRRRPDLLADFDLGVPTRPAFGTAHQPSPEDELLDDLLHGRLAAAVRALDPRLRATLVLVDVHDLSYAETAAVLGVPVGTVMSRLSRARNKVRRQLRSPAVQQGRSA